MVMVVVVVVVLVVVGRRSRGAMKGTAHWEKRRLSETTIFPKYIYT